MRTAFMTLLLCVLAFTPSTWAGVITGTSPLSGSYTATPLGNGLSQVAVDIVVTNQDGSYQPGTGWYWGIVGDHRLGNNDINSPYYCVGDFRVTEFLSISQPYTTLTTTCGTHNGYTGSPIFGQWIPSGVGDKFHVEFIITGEAPPVTTFSWLGGSENANLPEFQQMYRVDGQNTVSNVVPEPATVLLCFSGIGGLLVARKRKK